MTRCKGCEREGKCNTQLVMENDIDIEDIIDAIVHENITDDIAYSKAMDAFMENTAAVLGQIMGSECRNPRSAAEDFVRTFSAAVASGITGKKLAELMNRDLDTVYVTTH